MNKQMYYWVYDQGLKAPKLLNPTGRWKLRYEHGTCNMYIETREGKWHLEWISEHRIVDTPFIPDYEVIFECGK